MMSQCFSSESCWSGLVSRSGSWSGLLSSGPEVVGGDKVILIRRLTLAWMIPHDWE